MRWSTRARCGGSASRLGWRRFLSWGGVGLAGLQGGELRLQAGLVGGKGLLEDIALLGVHALGLGAEAPGLELGQLKCDALDLRVAPLDALGLRFDVLGLLRNMGEHLLGQRRQLGRVQSLEILGFGQLRIEHVGIVRANIELVIGAFSDCIWG